LNVLGIIAEYNPFHNGHFYHLNESKKRSGAEFSVAVMSGNFMQRGDVAMLSKWERAKIAVDCGIDLVLELPFVYACNNAEYFAKGAVQILNGIACVDTISFGSESGEMDKLYEVAHVISYETPEFKQMLKESLQKGNSFPKARAEAIRLTAGEGAEAILNRPNNILAVEYIKQLLMTKSKIAPITIPRKGQDDNSIVLAGAFSSAAAIRQSLKEHRDMERIRESVPAACLDNLKKLNIDINEKLNKLFLLICAKILSENEQNLEEIFSAGEGLGNKLKKEIRQSKDLEDLISRIKSKRYTRTRIQRLLAHTLLDLGTADFQYLLDNGLNYTRVLAFNDKGAALLKKIKAEKPRIPVITNINKQVHDQDEITRLMRYDILASDLYNLISGHDIHQNSDFVVRPYHKGITGYD